MPAFLGIWVKYRVTKIGNYWTFLNCKKKFVDRRVLGLAKCPVGLGDVCLHNLRISMPGQYFVS